MININKALNKDSYGFGAFLALISPPLTLFLFYYLLMLMAMLMKFSSFGTDQLYLLSLSSNILLMRYYLVSAKLMKTAKSILIVTCLFVAIFFIFLY